MEEEIRKNKKPIRMARKQMDPRRYGNKNDKRKSGRRRSTLTSSITINMTLMGSAKSNSITPFQ